MTFTFSSPDVNIVFFFFSVSKIHHHHMHDHMGSHAPLHGITCTITWNHMHHCPSLGPHSCTNPEVVLKYARWALKKDETLAVRIFMEQLSRDAKPPEELHPSRVLEYIQEFPTATLLYLEHIIVNRSVEVCR